MSYTISHQQFFSSQSPIVQGGLLQALFGQKGSLVFMFDDENVVLDIEVKPPGQPLRLEINGESPVLFQRQPEGGIGPNVFLPYFVDAYRIAIPHRSIICLGKATKSLAELLVRNLVMHLIRREPTSLALKAAPYQGSRIVGVHAQLRALCLAALGAATKHDALLGDGVQELLFANLVFKCRGFASARLERDSATLRELAAANTASGQAQALVEELMKCRKAVLDACY